MRPVNRGVKTCTEGDRYLKEVTQDLKRFDELLRALADQMEDDFLRAATQAELDGAVAALQTLRARISPPPAPKKRGGKNPAAKRKRDAKGGSTAKRRRGAGGTGGAARPVNLVADDVGVFVRKVESFCAAPAPGTAGTSSSAPAPAPTVAKVDELLQEAADHREELDRSCEGLHAARKNFYGLASKLYPRARASLIDRLGAYCSYCEMPVRASLAVEHVLPKAEYPEFSIDWENFLLACPICNSRKGDQPREAGARGRYAWPDTDPTANGFSYLLVDVTGNTEVEVALAVTDDYGEPKVRSSRALQAEQNPTGRRFDALGRLRLRAEYELGTLMLNEYGGEVWITDPEDREKPRISVAVRAEPLPPSGADPSKYQLTAQLCGLNSFIRDPAVCDRRVASRTMTWFRAQFALHDLSQMMDRPEAAALFADQVKATIPPTGFWSVWRYLLAESSAFLPHRDELIAFLDDHAHFPGTDPARSGVPRRGLPRRRKAAP